MAKEPTAAKAAPPEFIVASGQLVTGPRGKRQTFNVGDGYKPADQAERDDLIARGVIVSSAEFAKLAGGAAVVNALASAEARAQAAEARVAELEKAQTGTGGEGGTGGAGQQPTPTPAQ